MVVKISYFVHGTTQDNIEHLASGHNDIPLTEIGITQGKELGELRKDNFDVVITSDLKRAIDSAKLAWGNKFKIIIDKRLRECDYGDLTQKKKIWNVVDYIEKNYPNGESYHDVEARMKSFLEFVKKRFEGKHIALVAHQGPQLALEVLINYKTWKQAITEDWRNTTAWKPGWKYILK
tara:strand:- start:19 stop:552 length:534 start_codon:yes stop_codon:yes gene_type:complete